MPHRFNTARQMLVTKRQLIAALTLGAVGVVPTQSWANTQFTVTDLLDRRVSFDKQPEKFVVASYLPTFFMVGGASVLSRVVGIARDGWEKARVAEYKRFTEAFSDLKTIPSVGGYHDSVLNVERIIGLRPDVVLVDCLQADANAARLRLLEKAGIRVVVLDYHSMRPERHVRSTQILGRLLGREDRSNALCDRYLGVLKTIEERLKTIPETQKNQRVYLENGSNGVSRYGNTYNSEFLWGGMLKQLQARNIAADMKMSYGILDREYVISQNPEVLFIAGSVWINNAQTDQMHMGLTVTPEDAQHRLNGFVRREHWQKLSAIKTKRVHAVDHGSIRSMLDHAFFMYMAQVLYPETFADFDADKEIRSIYQTYLPELDSSGTYVLQWR